MRIWMRRLAKLIIVLGVIAVLALLFYPGASGKTLWAALDETASKDDRGLLAVIGDGTAEGLAREKSDEIVADLTDWIASERAAIEALRSGEMQVGGGEVEKPAAAPTPVAAKPQPAPEPAKPAPRKMPAAAEPAVAPVTPGIEKETVTLGAGEGATIGADGSVERTVPQGDDIFSGMVRKREGPSQMAEDDFWTEERIQAAKEYGEPTTGGPRPCIAFCGDDDDE